MKTLHIFKPGTHVPMAGAALNFSEADLAASARAYDPDLHEAPIVIGHPAHDAPAHGWVGALLADRTGLRAVPRQVNADFAELVRKGAYKKISASFYAPDAPANPAPGVYYLRHVGFLGAQPPAVKGLETVDLAEAETGVVCFEEGDDSSDADGKSFFERLRAWLLKNGGQDIADDVLPEDKVQELADQAPPADAAAVKADATADTVATELAQQVTEQAETIKRLTEENEALQANEGQADKKEAAAFAERLIREGRVLPRHRETVVAFLDAAAGRGRRSKAGVLEFGEGDQVRPLLPALRAFLASLPKAVEFAELATKPRAAVSRGEVNPLVADAERRAKSNK